MRIDFLITTLSGGGAERVVCNLSSYLAEKGYQVTITALRGDELKYAVDPRVSVCHLQKNYYRQKGKLYRISEMKTIYTFFRSLTSDGILACFLELPVAYSLIMRNIIKRKLVICERNNPLFYSKKYQILFKTFVRKADACVRQTTLIADWYRPLMKDRMVVVIPNPISKQILDAPFCDHKDKTIVTLGRLATQKNQKMLIEAFSCIAGDYPAYKLIIYGEGPLREKLEKLTESYGVQNKVLFPGFISDVVSALEHASLFVMTSEHEGMPNALQEAMAMGIPCISTDCGGGGAKELIENNKNGVLIQRGDIEALVNAMKKILSDVDYANKLASAALKIRNTHEEELIHNIWDKMFIKIENEIFL